MSVAPLLCDFESVWAQLGDDERRVLVAIAKRLAKGATQYGPLCVAADQRDWGREANEEFLDATVYLAIRTLS